MIISKKTVSLSYELEKVWSVLTNLKDSTWRSDIDKIEIVDDQTFIEFTKEGYQTTFKTTLQVPYVCWEFDLENENIKGHWIGNFKYNGKDTELELIEYIEVKKFFMKPFAKAYIKKQQELYVSDLIRALAK